jgi:hypothetical protein
VSPEPLIEKSPSCRARPCAPHLDVSELKTKQQQRRGNRLQTNRTQQTTNPHPTTTTTTKTTTTTTTTQQQQQTNNTTTTTAQHSVILWRVGLFRRGLRWGIEGVVPAGYSSSAVSSVLWRVAAQVVRRCCRGEAFGHRWALG